MGAEDTQIEASFSEAIRTAKKQKSVSLEKRAEETTQNIAGKKRSRQEEVDSDYLFANSSTSLPAKLVLSPTTSFKLQSTSRLISSLLRRFRPGISWFPVIPTVHQKGPPMNRCGSWDAYLQATFSVKSTVGVFAAIGS
jgi:hypothetical protein